MNEYCENCGKFIGGSGVLYFCSMVCARAYQVEQDRLIAAEEQTEFLDEFINSDRPSVEQLNQLERYLSKPNYWNDWPKVARRLLAEIRLQWGGMERANDELETLRAALEPTVNDGIPHVDYLKPAWAETALIRTDDLHSRVMALEKFALNGADTCSACGEKFQPGERSSFSAANTWQHVLCCTSATG